MSRSSKARHRKKLVVWAVPDDGLRTYRGDTVSIGEMKNATGLPSSDQEPSTDRASSTTNCNRLATRSQLNTGQ